MLKYRTDEENMGRLSAFDRTDDVVKIIEREFAASPSLFSFARLASGLKRTGRDIEVATLTHEPCACAAVYPELREALSPYKDDQ